jgi:hypothetical protein
MLRQLRLHNVAMGSAEQHWFAECELLLDRVRVRVLLIDPVCALRAATCVSTSLAPWSRLPIETARSPLQCSPPVSTRFVRSLYTSPDCVADWVAT